VALSSFQNRITTLTVLIPPLSSPSNIYGYFRTDEGFKIGMLNLGRRYVLRTSLIPCPEPRPVLGLSNYLIIPFLGCEVKAYFMTAEETFH